MITYEYRLPHDINSFRRSVGWYELSPRQLNCALKSSVFAICYIQDLIVIPEYQGQGIGREMLSRLMDKALSVADEGETIMINLMAAKDKEPFYEKLGFMRRPNDERGCGMTRFLKK